MSEKLLAGVSAVEITPADSQFLFGYPHVERYSTGVYDRLWASALYLACAGEHIMFIANDIIFVSKQSSAACRNRISEATGIATDRIMITATHTHSGPMTLDYLSNADDPIVPKTDVNYVKFMEDRIVQAGIAAFKKVVPAEAGLVIADATGIGTNRRDPSGPCDMDVPVLCVRDAESLDYIALMLVCSMHPTVLHEDSKLISGDFPGLARIYLQDNAVNEDCVILHHTGPAGNQSPRHVTTANTFDEAERLGEILGQAVEKVLGKAQYSDTLNLSAKSAFIDNPPRRTFPGVEEAKAKLDATREKFQQMQADGSPRQDVRTVECDLFGAEETYTLAKAAADGKMDEVCKSALPVEIQVFSVGEWNFVGWQGEIFIEFGLEVKSKCPNTFVISLANGEFQGYIVTDEAAAEGGYEASNAMFAPATGTMLVEKTIELLS